jgi:hypothetical protein
VAVECRLAGGGSLSYGWRLLQRQLEIEEVRPVVGPMMTGPTTG